MADIIDLTKAREEREMRRQKEREEAFDRELRRRLALFYAGQKLPADPIPDNPYGYF